MHPITSIDSQPRESDVTGYEGDRPSASMAIESYRVNASATIAFRTVGPFLPKIIIWLTRIWYDTRFEGLK